MLNRNSFKHPLTQSNKKMFGITTLLDFIESIKEEKKQRAYSEKHTGRTAALVIDMQEDFLIGTYQKERMISSQLEVLEFFVMYGLPVALTEFKGNKSTIKPIIEKLNRCEKKAYISKEEDDSFSNPKLLRKLKKWDISNLILMGVNANSCVKQTTYSALRNEFKIMTSPNLISDGYGVSNFECFYKESGIWLKDHRNLLKIISKEVKPYNSSGLFSSSERI